MPTPLTIAADQPRRSSGDLVLVRDDILDPALADHGYRLLSGHSPPENPAWVSLEPAWLSRSDLDADQVPTTPPGWPTRTATEVWGLIRTAIRATYDQVLAQLDEFVGFEVFVNRFPVSSHPFCAYHVDCDEGLRQREGIIRTPVWTSVVHLGPRSGLEGGHLALNLDGPGAYVDWLAKGWSPEVMPDSTAPSWMTISPRFNRLVVFSSAYSHFVHPVTAIPAEGPRLSVVAIAWDREPIGTDHEWVRLGE